MLKKRLSVVLPFVAVLAVVTAAATFPAPASKLELAEASANTWVKAHENALPTTLDSIASLPMLYRKAIHQKLTMKQRQSLWKQQLEAFVLPTDSLSAVQRQMVSELTVPLTDKQKSIIRMAIDSLPAIFSPLSVAGHPTSASNTLCELAKKAFSRREGGRILATLGPADSNYVRLTTSATVASHADLSFGLVSLVRVAVVKLGVVRAAKAGGCHCASYSFCDCDNCYQVQPPCTVQVTGCGCFFNYDCNGDCHRAE